ncbi:MAG TPA: hypothetical protein VGX91_06285 [Candidatus Cybelea sp.]|jgi:hypothetical protein|nr:hypothetical protein [Candidatus Cybelea sp.]
MKVIVKTAIVGGMGALFLGASVALSSATVVSGAGVAHPDKKNAVTCDKGGTTSACFTVKNTGTYGNALLGYSSSGAGLYGESTSSLGVIGVSSSNYGVLGSSSSNTGVIGLSSADGGGNAGVWGYGPNAYGVYGLSNASGLSGVYGYDPNAYGVYGENDSSSGYAAVEGNNPAGIGGIFFGNGSTYAALQTSEFDGTAGFPFVAFADGESSQTGEMWIDGSGDGVFTGAVTAEGGYKTVLQTRGGEKVGASVAMTAEATMEDTGTSRLLDGEAAVRFDPAFASTIDATRGYQVFLTPDGDTRGLYVAAKYERGFVVRELEHGRSSLNFDYRIVARPHGVSDVRLPQVDLKGPAMPHLKRPQPPQGKPSMQLPHL